MTRVRCIFVDTTVPVRIRPRMETSPVKGHFLSARRVPLAIIQFQIRQYPPFAAWKSCSRTNVCALNGGFRCPKPQANVLVPSSSALAYSRALRTLSFLVDEDMRLLLVGALRLHCQFGGHVCGCGNAVALAFTKIWRSVFKVRAAKTPASRDVPQIGSFLLR